MATISAAASEGVVSTRAPRGYPLPWCEALGAPYWQINFAMCSASSGWREFQRGKPMSEIIPEIDRRIARASRTEDALRSEQRE